MSEKQSIIHQYEQLLKERERVQQDQRPLVEESERLRLQITEHAGKHDAISVRLPTIPLAIGAHAYLRISGTSTDSSN